MSSKKGGAAEGKMKRKPLTSNKQLRKLGEPCKKVGRIEETSANDGDITHAVNSDPRPKPGEEGSAEKEKGHKDNKRKKARTRKEEYRRKAELRRKEKKEKAAQQEKKKKEREEALRRKGENKTKNQPKILVWFSKKDVEQQGQPVGGRKGVG